MLKKPLSTTDAISAFFADVSTRGHIGLLSASSGAIRFDVKDGETVERWHVAIDRGEVMVSHRNAKADAVVRVDRTVLNEIAEGRMNAMAAMLRDAFVAEGDLRVIIAFQRLFPGRSGSTGRVAPITEVRQSR